VAPANAHELSVVPEITEGTSGVLIGDRNYHSPKTKEELATMGIELVAPYSSKKKRSRPKKECLLEPPSLPHRHGLQPTRRALLRKAGVGTRPLASEESAAEEGAESHLSLLAQPSDRQPTSATGKAPPLKAAHQVS
jgi:hypothetical protein